MISSINFVRYSGRLLPSSLAQVSSPSRIFPVWQSNQNCRQLCNKTVKITPQLDVKAKTTARLFSSRASFNHKALYKLIKQQAEEEMTTLKWPTQGSFESIWKTMDLISRINCSFIDSYSGSGDHDPLDYEAETTYYQGIGYVMLGRDFYGDALHAFKNSQELYPENKAVIQEKIDNIYRVLNSKK